MSRFIEVTAPPAPPPKTMAVVLVGTHEQQFGVAVSKRTYDYHIHFGGNVEQQVRAGVNGDFSASVDTLEQFARGILRLIGRD